jgi:methylenetetrahydrofolate dehydrogenase (NADP+)/methenyltetrahydrofolate cyclohydrolase
MTAVIVEGKPIADAIINRVKRQITRMDKKPKLAVILVGSDPASKIYVANKQKACEACGIDSMLVQMNSNATTEDVRSAIWLLNGNTEISGILVQLPLPPHVDKFKVINDIDPRKDVDCFTSTNLGLLAQDQAVLQPCTPMAVLEIMKYCAFFEGKNIVIINDSIVVGRSLAMILLNNGATPTICNKRTTNLAAITRTADILVSAVGKPESFRVTKTHVKKGALVIDVGISRINGKIVGDVAEEVKELAEFITPSPGGVGPITVAMLMSNTAMAHAKLHGLEVKNENSVSK